MYWLDITLITILGFGALWGLFAGLLWQVSRVVTLVLAVYCSIALNAPLAQFLHARLLSTASPAVAALVAYAAVFLLVCMVLFGLTALLNHGIQQARLQWLNRSLGAVLGLLKAGLVLGLVLLGMNYLPITRDLVEPSQLAPPLTEGFKLALLALPQQYRDSLSLESLEKLEKLDSPSGSQPTLPARKVESTPSPLTGPPVGEQSQRPAPTVRPRPALQEEAERIARYLQNLR